MRRGDTLYGIAQRFGMTVDQLRSVNNLSPRTVIKVGDRLRISTQEDSEVSSARPSAPNSSNAIRYRVRPGDTLEEIASRHGVRISELMRWNNLRSADDIYAGSLLRVSMGDTPAPLTDGSGTR